MRYNDPTEKLCNTDVDRLEGADEPMGIKGNFRNKRLCSTIIEINDSHPLLDGQHFALKVEFTLGTSQYATMALREIMRAETSSQAQSTIAHD
jgi:tRNA pseudouridine13 synthase